MRASALGLLYVCHQSQQVASGTEHTGQGGLSSTAFCRRHGVTQQTNYIDFQSVNK